MSLEITLIVTAIAESQTDGLCYQKIYPKYNASYTTRLRDHGQNCRAILAVLECACDNTTAFGMV